MKYYPQLSELPATREMIDVFKGYNHNLRIGNGEFYDMKNLTSDDFPVLAPRAQRGIYVPSGIPQGMTAKESLCYVDGGDIIINGDERIAMGLTVDRDDEGNIIPKTLISMGAYIIIMPDKKYINASNTKDFGSIEASATTSYEVSFAPCMSDGGNMIVVTASTAAELADFKAQKHTDRYCLDTTVTPHVLKQYSISSGLLETVTTNYVKISSPGIGAQFEVFDGITIEGITADGYTDLNATMPIWAKDTNYIVVTGMPGESLTQETPITVTRKMPDLDFIIESGNRLWGCSYHQTEGGEFINEIRASKLGDFKNWDSYVGVSTDSYTVTVGTDGPFTGAIAYKSNPIFFKEGCMHKVLGSYPANYNVTATACRGVQKGCSRSLAIVNETLIYKSRSGVCAYDGALPYEISLPLGNVSYSRACAGALGSKYYISMADNTGKYSLFVYDLLRGLWHKEDNTHALDFCSCGDDLYYIEASRNHIKSVRGAGATEKTPVEWEAVTGVIGTDSPDKKYISRLDVRMSLVPGARVYIYVQYDSMGGWEQLYAATGVTLRSFAVPIKPRRCDHLRLKICGIGEGRLYSICKTIEQGSDV